MENLKMNRILKTNLEKIKLFVVCGGVLFALVSCSGNALKISDKNQFANINLESLYTKDYKTIAKFYTGKAGSELDSLLLLNQNVLKDRAILLELLKSKLNITDSQLAKISRFDFFEQLTWSKNFQNPSCYNVKFLRKNKLELMNIYLGKKKIVSQAINARNGYWEITDSLAIYNKYSFSFLKVGLENQQKIFKHLISLLDDIYKNKFEIATILKNDFEINLKGTFLEGLNLSDKKCNFDSASAPVIGWWLKMIGSR